MKANAELIADSYTAMANSLGTSVDDLDDEIKSVIKAFHLGEMGLLAATRHIEEIPWADEIVVNAFIHAVCPWLNSGVSSSL